MELLYCAVKVYGMDYQYFMRKPFELRFKMKYWNFVSDFVKVYRENT